MSQIGVYTFIGKAYSMPSLFLDDATRLQVFEYAHALGLRPGAALKQMLDAADTVMTDHAQGFTLGEAYTGPEGKTCLRAYDIAGQVAETAGRSVTGVEKVSVGDTTMTLAQAFYNKARRCGALSPDSNLEQAVAAAVKLTTDLRKLSTQNGNLHQGQPALQHPTQKGEIQSRLIAGINF